DGIRDFHVTGVQTCALPIFVLAADQAVRQKAALAESPEQLVQALSLGPAARADEDAMILRVGLFRKAAGEQLRRLRLGAGQDVEVDSLHPRLLRPHLSRVRLAPAGTGSAAAPAGRSRLSPCPTSRPCRRCPGGPSARLR